MSYPNRNLLSLSAQIVAAHASGNLVKANALPEVILCVFNALSGLHKPTSGDEAGGEQHDHGIQPAYPVRLEPSATSHAHNEYVHPIYGQTVFSDRLICMEDGLSMKMLKRHLLTVHGMTPDEYRKKWNLAETYPMVASEYTKLRSSLALQSGLGLKPEDRPAKGRKARRG